MLWSYESCNYTTYLARNWQHDFLCLRVLHLVSIVRDPGLFLNVGLYADDSVARATKIVHGIFLPKAIPHGLNHQHLPHLVQSDYSPAFWGYNTRVVKFVKDLCRFLYEAALHRQRLFYLGPKRIFGDLTCMYTTAYGLPDFTWDASFATSIRSIHHGHAFKIRQRRCNTLRRQNAFSTRVCTHWNELRERIENASSKKLFKTRLEARWQVLIPKIPL